MPLVLTSWAAALAIRPATVPDATDACVRLRALLAGRGLGAVADDAFAAVFAEACFLAAAGLTAAGLTVAGLAAADLVVDFVAALADLEDGAFLDAVAGFLRAGLTDAARLRWLSTMTHSSSVKDEGLLPWALASLAAFSMSLIRFTQEVANRLSDCERAPLSTSVSTTPAAVTFLRRRLKISF